MSSFVWVVFGINLDVAVLFHILCGMQREGGGQFGY